MNLELSHDLPPCSHLLYRSPRIVRNILCCHDITCPGSSDKGLIDYLGQGYSQYHHESIRTTYWKIKEWEAESIVFVIYTSEFFCSSCAVNQLCDWLTHFTFKGLCFLTGEIMKLDFIIHIEFWDLTVCSFVERWVSCPAPLDIWAN